MIAKVKVGGNSICRLADILSHIIKIDIITPKNEIIDPTDITFHAI